MSNATCEGPGLECGKLEAFNEAEFQFTKTGCITCHNVKENNTNELHSNWFVQPIKINNDWYVKSHFDHKSHLSIRNDDEKGICLSCHQADKSEKSTDILIPQQQVCLECHQQEASYSVELQCMQCHKFHFEENTNKALLK
jgi:c(7)-type cytochrome triheme protein